MILSSKSLAARAAMAATARIGSPGAGPSVSARGVCGYAGRGLVRAAGVEPAWAKARAILSRQCLPFHHARVSHQANVRPKRGFRRGDASPDRPVWQCRNGVSMAASSRPAPSDGGPGTRRVCLGKTGGPFGCEIHGTSDPLPVLAPVRGTAQVPDSRVIRHDDEYSDDLTFLRSLLPMFILCCPGFRSSYLWLMPYSLATA